MLTHQVARIAMLGLLTAATTFANTSNTEQGKSETSSWDEATLPTYLLQTQFTETQQEARNRTIESALSRLEAPRITSEFRLEENSQANTVRGKAQVKWRSQDDAVSLYLMGTYEARRYGADWETTIQPAIGVAYAPRENVTLALHVRDRSNREALDFDSQSMQSRLMFSF